MEPSEKMTPMLDPDSLLAEGAALAPPPPDTSFMARLMADAQRLQPPLPMPSPARAVVPRAVVPPAVVPPVRARPAGRGGLIDALADVFGGRGSLAAMMLATVTGLYLGVAQPSVLTSLTGFSNETPLDSLDLMSGSDSLWKETTP